MTPETMAAQNSQPAAEGVRTPFFKDRALYVLILVFCALRLLTLLTAIESVAWWEELYRGTIGKELVEGLKVPFLDYQADAYDGGSLVIGALASVFFRLLGPNLFALKLVPLFWSFGTLLVLYAFTRRFFGFRGARYAGALFVLGPPVLIRHSLTAIGSQTDSVLFSLAMFYFFYRYLFEIPRKIHFLILFGFTAGLGFWFSPNTGPAAAALWISWAVLDRKDCFDLARFRAWILSLTAGLIPWIFYNVTHRLDGVRYLAAAFLTDPSREGLLPNLPRLPWRMAEVWAGTIAPSFYFKDLFGVSGLVQNRIYFSLLLFPVLFFSFQHLAARTRNKTAAGKDLSKTVPLGIYLLVFTLVYALSGYPAKTDPLTGWISFRYVIPPLCFTLLLAAVLLSRYKIWKPILFALLVMGAAGYSPLVFKNTFASGLNSRGFSYYQLGDWWGRTLFPFPEKMNAMLEITKHWKKRNSRAFFRGVLFWADDSFWDQPSEGLKIYHRIPPEWRPRFAKNWGHRVASNNIRSIESFHQVAAMIPEHDQTFFYRGAAVSDWFNLCVFDPAHVTEHLRQFPLRAQYAAMNRAGKRYYDNEECSISRDVLDPFLAGLTEEHRKRFYRGAGWGYAREMYTREYLTKQYHLFLKEVSEADLPDFYYGVGWRLRWRMMNDRPRGLEYIRMLPESFQESALEGFNASEQYYRFKTP